MMDNVATYLQHVVWLGEGANAAVEDHMRRLFLHGVVPSQLELHGIVRRLLGVEFALELSQDSNSVSQQAEGRANVLTTRHRYWSYHKELFVYRRQSLGRLHEHHAVHAVGDVHPHGVDRAVIDEQSCELEVLVAVGGVRGRNLPGCSSLNQACLVSPAPTVSRGAPPPGPTTEWKSRLCSIPDSSLFVSST